MKGCMIEIEDGCYVPCIDTTIGNVLCDKCQSKNASVVSQDVNGGLDE